MDIAIMGTRGIPAAYGGFETFAQELSTRLAARGHRVWVYCRPHAVGARVDEFHGVRLVHLPSVRHKYLETLSHTFVSAVHMWARGPRVHIALVCNAANSLLAWMPRAAGARTVVNVDGLERQRRKWNAAGRAWYHLGEWLSTWAPNAIVTDAQCIQRYYREQYGKNSRFIPYGACEPSDHGTDVLSDIGLEPGRYVLYVSRLEPENNALLVVRAFAKVRTDLQLAVVGDAPYAADYIRQVRATSDPRIVFPGAVYGKGYQQLRAHAAAYVHATEVGGTHPALVEAMAAALPVLYLDTVENREVAGDAGIAFAHSEDALAGALQQVLDNAAQRGRLGELARERARRLYDWDVVTSAYEELFGDVLAGKDGVR